MQVQKAKREVAHQRISCPETEVSQVARLKLELQAARTGVSKAVEVIQLKDELKVELLEERRHRNEAVALYSEDARKIQGLEEQLAISLRPQQTLNTELNEAGIATKLIPLQPTGYLQPRIITRLQFSLVKNKRLRGHSTFYYCLAAGTTVGSAVGDKAQVLFPDVEMAPLP